MPTLATQNPTLADVAKRTDPDGQIDQIVEILNETNEVLADATFVEGNLPTGHRTSVRTGIPKPTWRKLYGGVQPTKSTTAQVTDNTGMLEAYAEVDKALADLNGNTAAFRMSEDRAHIEGMNQEMASTMFYGNEGDEPAEFTGLAPRFNALTGVPSADNVINNGGSGNNTTSLWLVVWGPNTAHCIYPKGSKAGLSITDKGQVTIENVDGNGGRMEGYRTHYRWDAGLTVRDWRYVARVVNVNMADLEGNDDSDLVAAQKRLIRDMIKASERIPQLGMGRAAWYCNRRVRASLRLAILEKVANNLAWETVAGKRVMTFDDIPVRVCDALTSNETALA